MNRSDFPEEFVFGSATSSYQIEGTTYGTCGRNHWDEFAKSGGTANSEDGSKACAHIENWESDLNLISQCGLQAYRFSTAWPRIQPEGKGQINQSGLDFYDALIDGLLARGIEPHLTLYHWDLPQTLAEKGGWTNRDTARYFGDFSAIVANKCGDRLKSIATINEPWCVAWLSHFLGHHAPGLTDLPSASKAMHYILLAHGLGMDAARSALSGDTQCQLGIVLNMEVSKAFSSSEEDVRASQIQDGIYNRWFADAIFKGAYPDDVLPHLEPHLPTGWATDLPTISQPIDWLGLNYYTRNLIRDDGTDRFPYGEAVTPVYNPDSDDRTSLNWEVYPKGLSYFLNRIHQEYSKDIPIVVSENGMASFDKVQNDRVEDQQRIDFFQKHLAEIKTCIDHGIPVKGYFAWSLLDNFEWAFGYDQRFGIVHVDFETQKRTPKASWHWWQKFLSAS